MTTATATHPLLAFVHALSGAVDKAAGHEPLFLPAEAKAELLAELHRQEQRLAALRLRALEALPEDLAPDLVARAEEHLVALCEDFGPRVLERLGRRILEVVAPDIAEEEEGRKLEDEERRARETTRLDFKRLGDGSTRVMAKLPDAVADRLRTYLDAFTSPRQDSQGHAGAGGGVSADGALIPASRKRGLAFAALLEHLDPQRLPDHGGDATTVVITLSLDQLRSGLGAAGVISSEHGDISATEARRLACTAQLIPAVLGSKGEVLDLGRRARLFSAAQHRALRLRDHGCRAEGCAVPVAWTEAHHWNPWSHGGPTNLDNGVLLCTFHHHRAHDNSYATDRLPNGDVRFSRRT